MRVRDTGRPTAVGGRATPSAKGEAPAGPAQTEPARPVDSASIMGVGQGDLTPQVRAALDTLMAEVQDLRGQLEIARKRIAYLEDLADRDALTPVLNRRAFVRELARMISFAERYGAPGSVLYFDIDGMKTINDRHGHAAGDAVIQAAAEALLQKLRGSDLIGRLGGDEFGVVLAQAGQDAAAAKADELADAIRSRPVDWNGVTLSVGVSVGVYTFAGGEGADDALNAADRAMYAQKHGTATSAA